ncbi:MAG: hypothetical protein ACTSU7_13095 [Candidatus Heimdallarchaeaceae archaeon]
MLSVTGIVAISKKVPIEEKEVNHGSFFNFSVVSQDPKTLKNSSYTASLFVSQKNAHHWRKNLAPGGVFYINAGGWEMVVYDENKFPIPKLKISEYNFRPLVNPYWIKQGTSDND